MYLVLWSLLSINSDLLHCENYIKFLFACNVCLQILVQMHLSVTMKYNLLFSLKYHIGLWALWTYLQNTKLAEHICRTWSWLNIHVCNSDYNFLLRKSRDPVEEVKSQSKPTRVPSWKKRLIEKRKNNGVRVGISQ